MKRIGAGLSIVLSLIALAQFLWFRSDKNINARHSHLVPMKQSWIRVAQPVLLDGFQLIDTQQQAFRPADLKGRWHIFLFGYTACPDVCPTNLRILAQALDLLKQAGGSEVPQAVFISVDPERDTPSRLSAYLEKIDSGFMGLSGRPAELKGLLHAVGSDYTIDREAGEVSVNHPTTLFLVNPQGQYVGLFTHPGQGAKLKEDIARAIKKEEDGDGA